MTNSIELEVACNMCYGDLVIYHGNNDDYDAETCECVA